MPRSPQVASFGESRRRATDPIRVAVAIRVYADLQDGGLDIQGVLAGELTTAYVAHALSIGTNVRIHALAADGSTLDRVRVLE